MYLLSFPEMVSIQNGSWSMTAVLEWDPARTSQRVGLHHRKCKTELESLLRPRDYHEAHLMEYRRKNHAPITANVPTLSLGKVPVLRLFPP